MEFETARCRVRPFARGDIAAFAAYRNDTAWMRHQGFKGLTVAQYEAVLLLGGQNLTTGMQLAVVDKTTDALLGDLYVKREDDTFWLGYTIAPAHARQGYACEAAQGAIAWMRAAGARRVLAGVEPENASSLALLEKLGFAYSHMGEEEEQIFALPL